MRITNFLAASVTALSIVGAAFAASANPVTTSEWAATGDNGSLGGIFAYINSNGVDPLTLPDSWNQGFGAGNVVFNATFDGVGYSNAGSWNNSDFIYSFGNPDTTSYGQIFYAPSVNLTAFDFLIYNASAAGADKAKLVIAAFNGSRAVGPALYSADVTVPVGSAFAWTNNGTFNVSLTTGNEYIAYLTVADVPSTSGAVPEAATWALMLVGFGGLGGALRVSRRRAALAA